MASELSVQTIKGPASGGNANKIIIPTGQTLEVTDNIRYEDMPAGSIIQVVSATYQTGVGTSGQSFVDTGLTASITPKSSSSKVFVTVSQAFSFTNSADDQYQGNLVITDGSNNILFGGTSYDQFRIKNMIAFHWQANLQVLHSPSTTSSFTYKTRMKSIYSNTAVYAQYGNAAPSSITLMEIAG